MRILYLILLWSLICCGQVFAETLELVTLQYPPYEFKEGGEVKGVAVEIVKEVFQRMKQPIHISLHPWARSLKKIEEGKADAIFTAYKNPERETYMDFSQEVLMPQIVSLFVRKDSDIAFDGDLSKLKQYTFGTVIQVSYGTVFDNAVKNKIITKIDHPAHTGEMNLEKLLRGRFDILVSNKYGAIAILTAMNARDKVKELSPEVQSVPSYIAFSKKRNLVYVRKEFDKVLRQMIDSGEYDAIIKSYFQ